MNAVDIMIQPVIIVGPDEPLHNVAKLLIDNNISGVPVVDCHGELCGMVTEADLLRRTELGTEYRRRSALAAFFTSDTKLTGEYIRGHATKVSEIMSRKLIVARPETTLREIVDILERNEINRVPIMEDRKVIGIVSRKDLVRALAMIEPVQAPDHVADSKIRRQLMAELSRAQWRRYKANNVSVMKGIVHFWGLIDTATECEALKVAAEGIPGVKGVVDHTVVSSLMVPMGM